MASLEDYAMALLLVGSIHITADTISNMPQLNGIQDKIENNNGKFKLNGEPRQLKNDETVYNPWKMTREWGVQSHGDVVEITTPDAANARHIMERSNPISRSR